MSRILLFIILSLFLVACGRVGGKLYGDEGLIKKRSVEYRGSTSAEKLKLPKGMTAEFQSTYDLPETPNVQQGGEKVELLPPGSVAPKIQSGEIEVKPVKKDKLKANEMTVVTSEDGTVYMNVDRPIEFVWYLLGDAAQPSGHRVASKDQLIYSYFILDVPSTGGVVTKETEIYQMQLYKMGEGTNVYLFDVAGKPLAADKSQRILNDFKSGILNPKSDSWFRGFIKRYFSEDNDK